MNRQEVAEKIKNGVELTENERKALAKLLTQKQYGLIWEDKPEAVEEMLHSHLPVLYEVPENAHTDATKHIANSDTLFPTALPNAPNHILIEGDNLHALTSLAFTHSGKIDVIYIDPPYNTGNRDFKYNDRYIDRDDAYRHSTWLSFMQKRLRIARDLLKETGVVFISIDDNEQAQLKLLCDEIFGEENFVANIAVINNFKGRSDAKYVATAHEYLLIYKRNTFETLGLPIPDEYIDEYKLEDEKGKYRLQGLRKRGAGAKREDRPNMYYPFFYNKLKNTLSLLKNNEDDIEILPKLSDGTDGRWRWGKETAQDRIDELIGQTVSSRNEYDVFQKDYLDINPNEQKRVKPKSFITGSEYSSDAGTKTLKEIIQENSFNNPKALDLIKFCLMQSAHSTATILDFFAGSGTTGHAVMALNAEDGGSRQFILCTNNEVNGIAKKLKEEGKSDEEIEEYGICRSVTLPRLQRVIKGYTKPNGTAVEGLKNNRLRYYRTDYVSREPSLKNKMELTRRATDLLSMRHNCYTPIETQNTDIQLFNNDDDLYLMVVYSEDAIQNAVEIISDLPKGVLVKTYVFSTGNDPYEDEFDDVADKVNLLPIPQVIYNTYQHLMQRMK